MPDLNQYLPATSNANAVFGGGMYDEDVATDAYAEPYVEGEQYAGGSNLLRVLKPLAHEEDVLTRIPKALSANRTLRDEAALARAQKLGFVVDPLDPLNIIDVHDPAVSISSAVMPRYMNDVLQNRHNFGYGLADRESQKVLSSNPATRDLMLEYLYSGEPFEGMHTQSFFTKGAPGSHYRGTDEGQRMVGAEEAEIAKQTNFPSTRNRWGPGVYHYPSEYAEARRMAGIPGSRQFVKEIPGERNLVVPQLSLPEQSPEVIKSLRSVFDFGAQEDYPVLNALRQLNYRYPALEFLKRLREAGLHGSVEVDRSPMPPAGMHIEFNDYNPSGWVPK